MNIRIQKENIIFSTMYVKDGTFSSYAEVSLKNLNPAIFGFKSKSTITDMSVSYSSNFQGDFFTLKCGNEQLIDALTEIEEKFFFALFKEFYNSDDSDDSDVENLCPDCSVYCTKRFSDGRCEE